MMCIGDLITPKLQSLFIKCALAELRTQRTWVRLFSGLEQNPGNLCMHDRIWHLQLVAERLYRREIKSFVSRMNRDRFDRKMLRIKTLQIAQCIEQGQAVLPSGDSDCNLIPLLDHLEFINSLTGQAQQAL